MAEESEKGKSVRKSQKNRFPSFPFSSQKGKSPLFLNFRENFYGAIKIFTLALFYRSFPCILIRSFLSFTPVFQFLPDTYFTPPSVQQLKLQPPPPPPPGFFLFGEIPSQQDSFYRFRPSFFPKVKKIPKMPKTDPPFFFPISRQVSDSISLPPPLPFPFLYLELTISALFLFFGLPQKDFFLPKGGMGKKLFHREIKKRVNAKGKAKKRYPRKAEQQARTTFHPSFSPSPQRKSAKK